MAKCTKCGKKGLFVRVNKEGLCKTCASNNKSIHSNSSNTSITAHVRRYKGVDIIRILEERNILRYFHFTEKEIEELSYITKNDTSFMSRATGSAENLFMSVAELLIFSEKEYNPIIAYKFLITILFFYQMDIVKIYFAELKLIERLYKLRNEHQDALKMCETLCIDNINNIPIFLSRIDNSSDFIPTANNIPNIPSIKRLAIIYENQGRISNAIEVSQLGAYFNPSQGYDTRIMRLIKKITPNDNSNSLEDIGLLYTYDDIKKCSDKIRVISHLSDVLYKKAHTYNKAINAPADYTVIDVETTGLNYNNDNIIELGAIKYRNYKETERFQTLVNPQCHIPESATAINHITDDMVKGQPHIADVIEKFIQFIDNDIIIGHNVGFDIRFILHACYILDMTNPNLTALDTLPLARRCIPSSYTAGYSLDELRKLLKITDNGHRAITDCEATNALYIYCQQK